MTEHPVLGGRYELEEVIGRGGMAEVWRAGDVRLGRPVAIKRLRADLASDPTFQARFRREAQAAAGLNHPNIVSVYDTGETDDPKSGLLIPYIVMELVQGHTLRDVLRDGRKIVPDKALEFSQGVLDALAYSHKAGIIHRDIKPANVMLTPGGQVKVMDFGIARAVADTSATMTQTAAVIGTAQYLSPEQARGETVDSRSDIYSAGCLLYELLVGKPPFTGDSPVSVAYQHVRELPTPPSEIDPEITPEMDAITLKALSKDPDDRYSTATEMREDIGRLLAGEPITASLPVVVAAVDDEATQVVSAPLVAPVPASAPSPAVMMTGEQPVYSPPERPRRGGLILLLILAVLLLVALAYGGWSLLRPENPAPSTPIATPATATASPTPTLVKVEVPALSGLTETAAGTTLTNSKLKVGKVTKVKGPDDDTKNTVTAQQFPAGTLLSQGSTVDITINVGPDQVNVPDLTGKTEAEAKAALETLGLKMATKADDPASENINAKLGTITTQDVAPGQPATKGDTITVTIATGNSIVPNVRGKTKDDAVAALNNAGFGDVKVIEQETTSGPAGTVVDQNPTDGNAYPRSEQVTITIAKAPPVQTVTPSAPSSEATQPSSQTPSP